MFYLFNGSHHIKQREQRYQGHEMPLSGNNNLIYLISRTFMHTFLFVLVNYILSLTMSLKMK